MKTIPLMLAIVLAPQAAFASLPVDILPNDELEFVVTDIISTGDHSDLLGSVTIGEAMRVRIPSVEPAEESETTYSLYTAHYALRGDWGFIYAPDGSPTTFGGPGAILSVTNDHPAWDALTWSAHGADGRIGLGTYMQDASVAFADPRRTALSSTALPGALPFSAFRNGDIAMRYAYLYGPARSVVLGRVTSTQANPGARHLRCQGFEPPMDRAREFRLNGGRRITLKSGLVDESGSPVTASGLVSPPIVRVLQLDGEGGFRCVIDLAAAEVEFEFKAGHWAYSMASLSLPGAGTYLLSMTSPDQDEYVIDTPCHVEITAQ
jgi:hypothetical protein